MPDIGLEITGTTDRSAVSTTRAAERGLLSSLSCYIARGTSQTGRTHVQAGIRQSTQPDGVFHTVLVDDYVYDGHTSSWTGMLPLEAGDELLLIVRSADAPTVRAVGRTVAAPFPLVHLEP